MSWFPIATLPKKESLVEARLSTAGFETFLPKIYEGKRQNISAPLFPGYMFVYSEPERLQQQLTFWKDSRTQTGISYLLVSPSNVPLSIPNETIFGIRMMLDPITGHLDISDERVQQVLFEKDDEVMILKGNPFAGYIGKFARMKSADRAIILLKILGAEREVGVDVVSLVKTEDYLIGGQV